MVDARRSVGVHPDRCGIVLAAGDGSRLRFLVRRLIGEPLPKQYVNFVGTRSMLEHTFRRAEKLIPRERLFTVVSQTHLGHLAVQCQLRDRARQTVIVQPENKDTGPGLLLPLVHVARRYPEATVAVFPSDHFILEESLFMAHVDKACRAVERDPSRIVLLGVEPSEPETEYGYILPGDALDPQAPLGLRSVARFLEKPQPLLARELVHRGGLWNTLVMTFQARALIDLMLTLTPGLARAFERIARAVGTAEERRVVEEAYRDMPPLNLSKGILELLPRRHPVRLAVLPVRGVQWSDWGSEKRVLRALCAGLLPSITPPATEAAYDNEPQPFEREGLWKR